MTAFLVCLGRGRGEWHEGRPGVRGGLAEQLSTEDSSPKNKLLVETGIHISGLNKASEM